MNRPAEDAALSHHMEAATPPDLAWPHTFSCRSLCDQRRQRALTGNPTGRCKIRFAGFELKEVVQSNAMQRDTLN